MKKLIISLDFDGVLAQALEIKKKYAKIWYNKKLTNEQTKREAFNKLNLEDNYDKFIDKIIYEHQDEFQIPKGCIQILTKLKQEGFEFIITTSRTHQRNKKAIEFINKHFPNIFSKIYNTQDKPKHDIITKTNPILHLDDDLIKLIQIEHEHILLVYFRQPENEHINIPKSHKHIKEVKSWKEFYYFCMKLKESN